MEQAQVIALLRQRAKEVGGQNELARLIGIDKGQFSKILHGQLPPGPAVLKYLGLHPKRVYERTGD